MNYKSNSLFYGICWLRLDCQRLYLTLQKYGKRFFLFFPYSLNSILTTSKDERSRSHLPRTFSDKTAKELRKQRVAAGPLDGFEVSARYSYTFWYLNSSKTVCLSQSEWWLAFPVSPLDKYKGPQLLKSDGRTVANPSVLRAKCKDTSPIGLGCTWQNPT